jgi:hypothetical protein
LEPITVLIRALPYIIHTTQSTRLDQPTIATMMFRSLAVALLAASASAFVPATGVSKRSSSMATTLSAAALEPPPLSPLTSWGDRISDIRAAQQQLRDQDMPAFSTTVSTKDLGIASDDTAAQLAYVKTNHMELKQKMQDHGAVIFRDFDLMKTSEGFQAFYAALGMKVCLDPLHSVSARPTVDGQKNSPVYEAVNKESRKNFFIGTYSIRAQSALSRIFRDCLDFILDSFTLTHPHSFNYYVTGMHNEFVGTRAPRAAAFVCFKAAEEGGEFLIADGRRMVRDLDPDLVEELYQRQIRYSVMELPFFGWVDNLPGPIQEPVSGMVKGLVSAAINAKVDFSVEMSWGLSDYDAVKMLQARAPRQPPIVVHPVTGEPTWFCNVHSHSSKLRLQRESMYVIVYILLL